MPLVLLTGIPSSGKTTVANRIAEFLTKEKGLKVVRVTEHEHFVSAEDKNAVLSDSGREKTLRGTLKSEMTRLLTPQDVVIMDSLNYIKGFRYELYCVSKSCKTTQVTVHCDVNPEEAWEWNSARTDGLAYDRIVFDGLLARYEEPCAANRWDSPLVSALSPKSGVDLPLEDIYAALYGRKPPPPNQSTQSAPLMPTNFLHELDRVTKDIVTAVLEAQKAGAVEGEDLTVPGTAEKFHLCRKLSMAELSRAKRQFITYAKTRSVEDIHKLATMFVQHLNRSADTT